MMNKFIHRTFYSMFIYIPQRWTRAARRQQLRSKEFWNLDSLDLLQARLTHPGKGEIPIVTGKSLKRKYDGNYARVRDGMKLEQKLTFGTRKNWFPFKFMFSSMISLGGNQIWSPIYGHFAKVSLRQRLFYAKTVLRRFSFEALLIWPFFSATISPIMPDGLCVFRRRQRGRCAQRKFCELHIKWPIGDLWCKILVYRKSICRSQFNPIFSILWFHGTCSGQGRVALKAFKHLTRMNFFIQFLPIDFVIHCEELHSASLSCVDLRHRCSNVLWCEFSDKGSTAFMVRQNVTNELNVIILNYICNLIVFHFISLPLVPSFELLSSFA